ncbi:MAG: hypothetical protein II790_06340 [Schwartzia sp.]|nr:hypothetical protein [Schwartzia sp. (in: firmicutes)]
MATLPPTISPDANIPAAPQAGDVMTELPGTLDENTIQASATLPAPGANPNAQPIPTVPVQPQQQDQQPQGQAPVLFMPGNINPQYPNTPSTPGALQ